MAIKFSEFNVGATTSDIDYLVGYKNTDNVQIPVGLVGTDTTYTVSTAQAGANETITLTGSDSSTDLITITAGNDISLTDDGAGNGFTIASTVVGDTYTIGTSTNGSSVDVNLDAAAGADTNITLTPGTGLSITQAADVVTLTNTAPGDTYTLGAGAKAGSSVPLNLDAATGSDSVVNLTEGTGITLTQTSATEITIEGSAGTTVVKDQFTGNNSTTAFTLSVTPTAAANLNIFISGVYQNSVDSGGAANYSVSGTTLTFVTPPPTTSTNGIEVVITQ
ncbi:MAG: hypothetical protein AB8G86_11065 [Saprospiraceae bacterium]|jgi:hypothetical protein